VAVNDRPATDNEHHLAPLHTHVSRRWRKYRPLARIEWRATVRPRRLLRA